MKKVNSGFLTVVLFSCLILFHGCNNQEGTTESIGADSVLKRNPTKTDEISEQSGTTGPNCNLYQKLNAEKARFRFCGNLHDSECIYSFSAKDTSTWTRRAETVFYGPKKRILKYDQKISITNLETVFKQILSDKTNYQPDSNDISALKMTYGLNISEDSLIIIYSPLIIKNATLSDISNSPSNSIQQIEYFDDLYELTESRWEVKKINNQYTFSRISEATAQADIDRFQKSVEIYDPIKPRRNPAFDTTNDFIKGDIKFTFMSFQQLFWMYCDNQANSATTDLLTFLPVAGRYKRTGHKLHVVVSRGNLQDDSQLMKDGVNNFQMLAADASQMCPPKCQSTTAKTVVDSIEKDLPGARHQ